MGVFAYDHTLDQLPVPNLADTCEDLKRRIRPLAEDAVYKDTLAALESFCTDPAQGPALQKKLEAWQQSLPGNASWLRRIWDDNYMSDRSPTTLNHYTFQFLPGRWGEDPLPLFASALAQSIQGIRLEDLPPEASRCGYESMDGLRSMIYTRLPGAVRDTLFFPSLAEPLTAAVVCRGHWFLLSLTDSAGNICPPAALKEGFEWIEKAAASREPGPGVSAFTSANRQEAFELHAALQQHVLNRYSLESIEKAAFVICMDEPAPDETAYGASLVCGPAGSRWYDKNVQIVSAGERIGVSLEHSGCDAGIWIYLFSQADKLIGSGKVTEGATSESVHVQYLDWYVPDGLARRLAEAEKRLDEWAGRLSFAQRTMTSLSKGLIKELKCSPDAFVQALFQIAYYGQEKRPRSVYESVSSRAFYGGRTECMRPRTVESMEFVKAFAAGAPRAELRQKFEALAEAHRAGLSRCQQGSGSERHMSGLLTMQQMYFEGQPLPAIFHSEGFRLLKHDALSTSNCTADFIKYFGFCPVVEDGVGLGYNVKDGSVGVMLVTSADSGIDPDLYLQTLEEAGQQLLKDLAVD